MRSKSKRALYREKNVKNDEKEENWRKTKNNENQENKPCNSQKRERTFHSSSIEKRHRADLNRRVPEDRGSLRPLQWFLKDMQPLAILRNGQAMRLWHIQKENTEYPLNALCCRLWRILAFAHQNRITTSSRIILFVLTAIPRKGLPPRQLYSLILHARPDGGDAWFDSGTYFFSRAIFCTIYLNKATH